MSQLGEGQSRVVSCRLFSDRHGGASTGCFDSLNVGCGVGDSPVHVKENRNMIKKQAGVKVLISAHQVHGNVVEVITDDISSDVQVDGVDALITDRQGLGLMVQLADCQGILVHDPIRSVVAAIHCGWRGSVSGIIGDTVRQMSTVFGSNPLNMHAAVSPSLGPCCAEFIHHEKELPRQFHSYQVRPNYFDFWEITRRQLRDSGLADNKIEIAGVCTSCSADYFSYRRAVRTGDGKTGRHCALISLRAGC